jgi:NAD(P)-dependent dehydrogenase (short-subunit alcohol dehydrogenase family)
MGAAAFMAETIYSNWPIGTTSAWARTGVANPLRSRFDAGVYRFAPLEEVREDEFHRQFNIAVLGVLLASREAVKFFGPDGGSIINISSVASTSPMPTRWSIRRARRGWSGHR